MIYFYLQSVYASSLCTLLEPTSLSSMYIYYTFYCSLESVYASSLFTSHLSIMNHRFWGCISQLSIHLVICCLLHSVHTSSIQTAGHLSHFSIHIVEILCYFLSQDQTTLLFNCYLRPVQDLLMLHQCVLFLQSLLLPHIIVIKEQEATKHRPVFQLYSGPHQSTCCSQEKLKKGGTVSTLKVLSSSSDASSPSSSYSILSHPSVTSHTVSTLLMLSFLVLILLSTAKQDVEQVSLQQSIPIGGKHCVRNEIFYIFITILWFGYSHRIVHCLWTIGNYNSCSIFMTTRIITMIGGVLYSENIVLCSRVLARCTFSLTSCMSFSRSSQI